MKVDYVKKVGNLFYLNNLDKTKADELFKKMKTGLNAEVEDTARD